MVAASYGLLLGLGHVHVHGGQIVGEGEGEGAGVGGVVFVLALVLKVLLLLLLLGSGAGVRYGGDVQIDIGGMKYVEFAAPLAAVVAFSVEEFEEAAGSEDGGRRPVVGELLYGGV